MDFLDVMSSLGVALGLGLLVGLQREYAKRRTQEDLLGGSRTFALIAAAGALATMLSEAAGTYLVLATIAAGVILFLAIGYVRSTREGHIGMTTEVAALIVFCAGAFSGFGELPIAVAIGVLTATVLAIKPFTRQLSASIETEDISATLKFAVVAALALPLLPDQTYGSSPWDAVSPYKVGLMVVFISGLSFVGYVLIQLVGAERGIGLTSLLGGLVSSTAVTMTLSERSRSHRSMSNLLALGVLLAWVIMFGRILVEVGVVNPGLLASVWIPIFGAGLIAGGWAAWLYTRSVDGISETEEPRTFTNPFRLGPAIQFGLLYGLVLIGSKALSEWLGATGIYAGAIVSGLADVDAITLSMAELSRGTGVVEDDVAANAIVFAAASNTLVKAGIVWVIGSPGIRKAVFPGALAAVIVSVGLSLAL
ncbi:MAG: DUF4010 domain-containing protein [Acidimicrobiia bacterium]|nr:DUF4010 domain-containing protein [Acidimicrobiia bacterium]